MLFGDNIMCEEPMSKGAKKEAALSSTTAMLVDAGASESESGNMMASEHDGPTPLNIIQNRASRATAVKEASTSTMNHKGQGPRKCSHSIAMILSSGSQSEPHTPNIVSKWARFALVNSSLELSVSEITPAAPTIQCKLAVGKMNKTSAATKLMATTKKGGKKRQQKIKSMELISDKEDVKEEITTPPSMLSSSEHYS